MFGIFASLFIHGIAQEKLMRTKFGDRINEDGSRGEVFPLVYHFSVVFGIQSLLTTIATYSKYHSKHKTAYIVREVLKKSKNLLFFQS